MLTNTLVVQRENHSTLLFCVWLYAWVVGKADSDKGLRVYVLEAELMRLSLLIFEERRLANMWFDLFIDVKQIGWEGVFREQNMKWNEILGYNKSEYALKKENGNAVPVMVGEVFGKHIIRLRDENQ